MRDNITLHHQLFYVKQWHLMHSCNNFCLRLILFLYVNFSLHFFLTLNILHYGITEAVIEISVESIYFTDLKSMTYFLKAVFKGLHPFFWHVSFNVHRSRWDSEVVIWQSILWGGGEGSASSMRERMWESQSFTQTFAKLELPSETKPLVEKLRKNWKYLDFWLECWLPPRHVFTNRCGW